MKIAIGADHAGYQLKDSLKRLLDELGLPYEDFGTTNGQSVNFPAREIVKTFIQTPFEGGRHAARVGKIYSIDR